MTKKALLPNNHRAEDESDLAERLANYRSRAAREGRKVAVEKIDRAIQEARQRKAAKG